MVPLRDLAAMLIAAGTVIVILSIIDIYDRRKK